ncbi:MAG: c-type cytochrome [Candidatus Obscuribacterales bacterium]|nr:c-type cytochrome [Candidatus Obscuribacterales bacterium]
MFTVARVFLRAKKTQFLLRFVSVITCFPFIYCADVRAQDAASIYKEKCAGCHTIGGGDMVGPDLARCRSWPDAELQESIKRMEVNTGPLTDAEVKSLLGYLKNSTAKSTLPGKQSPSSEATPDQSSASQVEAVSQKTIPEPASAERGKRLFYGEESFKNGGLSCIACHSIDHNGGNMAPDLTGISERMPVAALVSACENTPFKVMKAAYKEHAILHQEALDLQSYLASLKEPHEKAVRHPLGLYAGIFAAIALAFIAFGYRGRNASVRSKLKRRD